MRKSILYVGGMEFPDKNAAAQRVIANSKILNELGYNIILAGMSKQKEKFNPNYSSDKININNSEVYSRSYPKGIISWVDYIFNINNVIKFIKKNPQKNIVAVIAYNYPSIALLKLKRYCEKNNIRVIADCTEWYGKASIIKSIDTSFRMRYVHKKVSNIICISDYLENYYKNQGCLTVNIPSLIDKKDPKWNKVEYLVTNDVKIFSYVGSPGINKDKDRLDFIIKAFFQIQNYDFKFQIIGMTEEEFLIYFPDFKNIIIELSDKIIFYGRLSHVKSLEKIKKSDFSIFARMDNRVTRAGFPTKLAESFACGTPIVTNPNSNISKYIYQGKNGFLAEDASLESFKIAILQALDIDRKIVQQMKAFSMNENPLDYRHFEEDSKKFIDRILN